MIEKRCIIIDDKSQNRSIKNIVETLEKDGIKLICVELNPKDKKYRKNIGTDEIPKYAIDIDLVLEELSTDKYFRKRVDLIACDYDLQDDVINGFEIIIALRINSYKNAVILYSGSHNAVINRILDEPRRRDQIRKIKRLSAANISRFTERGDFRETVIGIIGRETFSLNYTIEKLLESLPENLEFKSIPHEFKDRSVEEILDEIKSETDLGHKFQKEILEFAVSNLVELNADD